MINLFILSLPRYTTFLFILIFIMFRLSHIHSTAGESRANSSNCHDTVTQERCWQCEPRAKTEVEPSQHRRYYRLSLKSRAAVGKCWRAFPAVDFSRLFFQWKSCSFVREFDGWWWGFGGTRWDFASMWTIHSVWLRDFIDKIRHGSSTTRELVEPETFLGK